MGGNFNPISDFGGNNPQSMVNIEKARRIASEIVTSLSPGDEIGIATLQNKPPKLL